MAKRRSLNDAIEASPELDQILGRKTVQQVVEATTHVGEHIVPLTHIQSSFSFNQGKALRYTYDVEEIETWAKTEIQSNGIRNPLWVRPLPRHLREQSAAGNGASLHYELVAGMRRYLAARVLGLEQVPVKVFPWSDAEALSAARAENFQRREFTELEELDHILALLSEALNVGVEEVVSLLYQMKNEASGNTKQNVLLNPPAQTVMQVFKALGRMSWRSFIETRLRLRNKPPEILDAIRSGQLHYTKGIVLSTVKDGMVRQSLLENAVTNQWTFEQVQQQVASASSKTDSKSEHAEPTPQQQVFDVLKQVRSSKAPIWRNQKKVEKLMMHIDEIKKLLEM